MGIFSSESRRLRISLLGGAGNFHLKLKSAFAPPSWLVTGNNRFSAILRLSGFVLKVKLRTPRPLERISFRSSLKNRVVSPDRVKTTTLCVFFFLEREARHNHQSFRWLYEKSFFQDILMSVIRLLALLLFFLVSHISHFWSVCVFSLDMASFFLLSKSRVVLSWFSRFFMFFTMFLSSQAMLYRTLTHLVKRHRFRCISVFFFAFLFAVYKVKISVEFLFSVLPWMTNRASHFDPSFYSFLLQFKNFDPIRLMNFLYSLV